MTLEVLRTETSTLKRRKQLPADSAVAVVYHAPILAAALPERSLLYRGPILDPGLASVDCTIRRTHGSRAAGISPPPLPGAAAIARRGGTSFADVGIPPEPRTRRPPAFVCLWSLGHYYEPRPNPAER